LLFDNCMVIGYRSASNYQGSRMDALALGSDEGRGRLR